MRRLLPLLLLFLGAGAHAAIPTPDAQWSVNEQGRTGDSCFFEHINGTLEDCTNTVGTDTSNTIDGIDFDGTDDYVDGGFPAGVSTNFVNTSFTIAVRVEPDVADTGYEHIFGVFENGDDTNRFQIYKNDFGTPGGETAGSNANTYTGSSNNAATEQVLVWRRDGNEYSFWKDGTEGDIVTDATAYSMTLDIAAFGARRDGNMATLPQYFNGTILWAAIWESALTDSQIQELDDSAMPFASDTTAPSYTVGPACGSVTSDTANCTATATDTLLIVDHYMAVYSDGATAPTCANVKAGTGTGFITGTADSDLDVVSGVSASMTSGANLSASTAYDVYFCAEDNSANATAVQLVNITTTGSNTTVWADETVDIGTQDMVGTITSAFSAAADECEMASGDQIPVTSNGTTTSGTCDVTKAMFLSGGGLSNTRIASATTAFLRNTTETSTADNMTFNSPDNGTDEHFGTSTCADPACDNDSLYENADFKTAYPAHASGDDVWVSVSGGACDFNPATGVFSATLLPCSGTVRVYDVSATDWLTESTWLIESPDGGCDFGIARQPNIRLVSYTPLKTTVCN